MIFHLDAVDSDDIEQLLRELEKAQDHLQMAGDILRDYRSFCRRVSTTSYPFQSYSWLFPMQFVPSPPAPPPPPPSPSLPLPLYPRPNTSFLSRLVSSLTPALSHPHTQFEHNNLSRILLVVCLQNAAHRRIPRSVSDSHLSGLRRPKKSLGHNRRFKTRSYPNTSQ